MLETIYNDAYSELTLINNLNKETLYIIDSDYKVYGFISYNPFEPSNEDILDAWKRATSDYFELDNKTDHLVSYRASMKQRSDTAFKDWLDEDSGEHANA